MKTIFLIIMMIQCETVYATSNAYAPAFAAPTSSDEIAGVTYPKFKMTVGENGTATAVSATNPLPITGSISVSAGVNTAGSISNNASVGSGSATTFTKPANAVGFILENESLTTIPIRWAVGSTATSSVGNYYEAGRDTGYIPLAANISVIGVGGTASVSVQWILSN